MERYFDTGVILELYTLERSSPSVRRFVRKQGEAIAFSSLHWSECVSAMRLKCFRKENGENEASAALLDIDADRKSGVLRDIFIDSDTARGECRVLSDAHASSTGCPTLDALHEACARHLGIREFVTMDSKQGKLAQKACMRVPRL